MAKHNEIMIDINLDEVTADPSAYKYTTMLALNRDAFKALISKKLEHKS
jgi:hypothetical protein